MPFEMVRAWCVGTNSNGCAAFISAHLATDARKGRWYVPMNSPTAAAGLACDWRGFMF
jgi:hypothetical protein